MIRHATPLDAESVAPLIFQAMPDIAYKIIGTIDKEKAISFLKTLFIQKNNQYSHENTFVFEKEGKILGSIVFYSGSKLELLRKPVLDLAYQLHKNKVFLEDETTTGETYIDTLSVNKTAQGKGIGSLLLQHLINYAKKQQLEKLCLLVEISNIKAQKMYKKNGFLAAEKTNLAGGVYLRMIHSAFLK